MNRSFVSTDEQGRFALDGKPWFLHCAVYFGRRPGTCGADWMGENFEHNLAFLERDIDTMHRLGINTLGLFIPSYAFFDGIAPAPQRFDQLHAFLERLRQGEMRAILLDLWGVSKEAWCAARGVEPGEGLWNAAIHPEAEQAAIYSRQVLRAPFATRPEIAGWVTDVGRFFDYKFTVPAVRPAWTAWLRRRFDWDFALVRECFGLSPEENTWERVRMPTEMEPYFSRENPRSHEFALMQQSLCTKGLNRMIKAVRPFTPNHLQVTSMEGCCFSSGNLTCHIPDEVEADALWAECYHWEGLRSYHFVDEAGQRWMPEPVANKPSVEILNAVGYVQMLTHWMKRSRKALILCHGVDIGDQRRGVRSEQDQEQMLARYNEVYLASGGSGVAYWCWSDDELSKTFTRQFGYEFGSDTDESEKQYQQAGETMGLVRYDGTPRPVGEKIRQVSERMARQTFEKAPADPEVLVLAPSPLFNSLYRYRANQTVFGVFTSLARAGISARLAMTSAGETMVSLDELSKHRLVIIAASSYTQDHPETADILLRYVEAGGALFLPLASPDSLRDEYFQPQSSPALRALSGCERSEIIERACLEQVEVCSPAFTGTLPADWSLEMGEPARFSQVQPGKTAEVLALAGGMPLLYRHPVGKGWVYCFTWNLDVFLYSGSVIDHNSDAWDGLWHGIAAELGLRQDASSPIRRVIEEMAGQT